MSRVVSVLVGLARLICHSRFSLFDIVAFGSVWSIVDAGRAVLPVWVSVTVLLLLSVVIGFVSAALSRIVGADE